jgi:integrase
MATSARSRIPSYRLHKPTGLAVVRISGRDVYLGAHGSPESHEKYKRVIAEWLTAHPVSCATGAKSTNEPASFTINELILGYLDFAKGYYVKAGAPTGEMPNIEQALRPLASLYGRVEVRGFGPVALKAVRQAMVDQDLCRKVVNARVNRLRRMFKWGVENQIAPAAVLLALQAVAPLKAGRGHARESQPVQPVPEAHIDAVVAVAPPRLAAMIRLQQWTGMRPGELVQMRTADVDMNGPVWTYRPREHKTEHHGRDRVIYLGPRAQAVLRPWLRTRVDEAVFQPKDVMEQVRRMWREARVSPMTPSQAARRPLPNPKRTAGSHYTPQTYGRAIGYACIRAFPHPVLDAVPARTLTAEQRAELSRWRAVHHWSPNQLRHTAATMLRREFGIEAARVVLGHGSAQVTEIYAEQDFGLAKQIMARVG